MGSVPRSLVDIDDFRQLAYSIIFQIEKLENIIVQFFFVEDWINKTFEHREMLENPEVMFGTSGLVKSEGLPQHVKAKGRDRILLPKGQSYMERMISKWSEPLIRRHSAGSKLS